MKTQNAWAAAVAAVVLATVNPVVAQEQVRPHPQAILHSFPGTQVYPESVAVDQSTGTFYVGSVKEGTIFKGQVGTAKIEIFSPACLRTSGIPAVRIGPPWWARHDKGPD